MRTPRPFALPVVPTSGRDLVALGVTDRMLCRAVGAGRLVRLCRDVYLDAGRWGSGPGQDHLLLAIAHQVARPQAVISHRSAALFWRIPLPDEDWAREPVWLSLPPGGPYRSESSVGRIVRIAPLPDHQVFAGRSGLRVTGPARTAVDVARNLPLPEGLQVLDGALRRLCLAVMPGARRSEFAPGSPLVLAGLTALEDAAAGLPGMAAVSGMLQHASPLRESPIESLSFGHMIGCGLPAPVCQHLVRTPLGDFFPDFYWSEQRLIGEADGREKYADTDAILREKEREQVLRDLGYGIVRWLGREIHQNPDVVMARIRRALAEATR